jgi:hypothetical protein
MVFRLSPPKAHAYLRGGQTSRYIAPAHSSMSAQRIPKATSSSRQGVRTADQFSMPRHHHTSAQFYTPSHAARTATAYANAPDPFYGSSHAAHTSSYAQEPFYAASSSHAARIAAANHAARTAAAYNNAARTAAAFHAAAEQQQYFRSYAPSPQTASSFIPNTSSQMYSPYYYRPEESLHTAARCYGDDDDEDEVSWGR